MSNYQRYEQLKAAWKEANPGATPAQYEKAIALIAKKLGL